jgi:hypothetical protein
MAGATRRAMRSTRSSRAAATWTAGAGIGVVALFVASGIILPITDAPETGARARDVTSFISDHRGEWLAVMYLSGLSFTVMIGFIAGLRWHLRRAEGSDGSLSGLFYAGGLVAIAVLLAGFAAAVVAAYRVDTASAELTQSLYDLTWALFAFSNFGFALALGAAGYLIVRDQALPPWVGWFGIAVALLHLVAAAVYFASEGFLSLEGDLAIYTPLAFYLWVAGVSVELLRSR